MDGNMKHSFPFNVAGLAIGLWIASNSGASAVDRDGHLGSSSDSSVYSYPPPPPPRHTSLPFTEKTSDYRNNEQNCDVYSVRLLQERPPPPPPPIPPPSFSTDHNHYIQSERNHNHPPPPPRMKQSTIRTDTMIMYPPPPPPPPRKHSYSKTQDSLLEHAPTPTPTRPIPQRQTTKWRPPWLDFAVRLPNHSLSTLLQSEEDVERKMIADLLNDVQQQHNDEEEGKYHLLHRKALVVPSDILPWLDACIHLSMETAEVVSQLKQAMDQQQRLQEQHEHALEMQRDYFQRQIRLLLSRQGESEEEIDLSSWLQEDTKEHEELLSEEEEDYLSDHGVDSETDDDEMNQPSLHNVWDHGWESTKHGDSKKTVQYHIISPRTRSEYALTKLPFPVHRHELNNRLSSCQLTFDDPDAEVLDDFDLYILGHSGGHSTEVDSRNHEDDAMVETSSPHVWWLDESDNEQLDDDEVWMLLEANAQDALDDIDEPTQHTKSTETKPMLPHPPPPPSPPHEKASVTSFQRNGSQESSKKPNTEENKDQTQQKRASGWSILRPFGLFTRSDKSTQDAIDDSDDLSGHLPSASSRQVVDDDYVKEELHLGESAVSERQTHLSYNHRPPPPPPPRYSQHYTNANTV